MASEAYSNTFPKAYAKTPVDKIDIQKLLTYIPPKLDPFPQGNAEPKEVSRIEKQIITPKIVSKLSLTRSEWLLKLRNCESGGNYKTNTGNTFYGAYQFMIPTWNSIAMYKVDDYIDRPDLIGVRPDLASPADQDYMILKNTMGTAGLVSQNPGCYAIIGLSNRPPK